MNSLKKNPGRADAFQNTVAALAVVIVAGVAADFVLWPRDQLPAVATVSQNDFFTQAFIDRAQDFRGVQSWLGIAALLMLVAVPLALALWWPRTEWLRAPGSRWADRRSGARFGRGGLLAGAGVAAAVSTLALLAALPFEFLAFRRSRDFGLSVQSTGGWLFDQFLSGVITVAVIALLALIGIALLRHLKRWWWLAFGGCLIVVAVVFQLLSPTLIAPLFAGYTKLPVGELRTETETLARRAGVKPGEIYLVDASKRTTGANAFVTGLGSTKRVVIYDTLVRDFTPAERRLVLAHELGHAHRKDLIYGLVWFAFVALASMFAVDLFGRVLADRRGVDLDSPAGVAMLLAAAMLAVAISQPAANALSRRVEARADAFAMKITGQPDAAIALEQRLTRQNLSRPVPPAVRQWIFGTHPTPMDRIGMAVTVSREQRR